MRLIEHNLILREKRSSRSKKRADDDGDQERNVDRMTLLRPFSNISVYSGVRTIHLVENYF